MRAAQAPFEIRSVRLLVSYSSSAANVAMLSPESRMRLLNFHNFGRFRIEVFSHFLNNLSVLNFVYSSRGYEAANECECRRSDGR